MSIVRVKSFLIIRSKLQLVFRNSDQENGRPTGSQTKLHVPTALAELFSNRSNTCFNATSCSRRAVSRLSTALATRTATQRSCYSLAQRKQPPRGFARRRVLSSGVDDFC